MEEKNVRSIRKNKHYHHSPNKNSDKSIKNLPISRTNQFSKLRKHLITELLGYLNLDEKVSFILKLNKLFRDLFISNIYELNFKDILTMKKDCKLYLLTKSLHNLKNLDISQTYLTDQSDSKFDLTFLYKYEFLKAINFKSFPLIKLNLFRHTLILL